MSPPDPNPKTPPPDLLAKMAADSLAGPLWQLGLKAADLPPETGLEAVETLELTAFNHWPWGLDDIVLRRARGLCYRNALFMLAELSARLAPASHTTLAQRYKHCLHALLWRDAVEYHLADQLDQETNQVGFNAPDYRERAILADQREVAWEKAGIAAQVAFKELWGDYEYECVWEEP